MSTVEPEAFIAIEEAMNGSLTKEWATYLIPFMRELSALAGKRQWYAAHELIDQITLDTVVDEARERIEELSVSALLFGAQNASGSLATTSYVSKAKALPEGLQQAIGQLDMSIRHSIAEEMRWELHRVVQELEEQERYAALTKYEASTEEQTLYVHRPLVNSAQLISWAHSQGFTRVLEQHDFHVTVCFSRRPMTWQSVAPDVPEVIALGGKREIHKFGKAIVLTFESAELQDRHDEFIEAGASFDYPEYRPHVTLTYSGEAPDLSTIVPYDDELIFGPEEFAPVKDDWAGSIVENRLVKAERMTLAQRLNAAVLENKQLVDLSGSLTTSRLISLGFLSEAVEQNITTYQVNEVLDEVTCSVCREMHGKTFSVVHEYSKIVTALQTTDPQELRSIAPWPKNTKAGVEALKGMSEDEMQLAGYGSPPYHPRCRGFIVTVGTVTDETKMRVPASVDPDALFDVQLPPQRSEPSKYGVLEPDAEDIFASDFHFADRKVLRSSHDKLPEYVDEYENASLRSYTGAGYQNLNAYQRGEGKLSASELAEAQQMAAELNSMMSPLSQDYIVYRGLPGWHKLDVVLDIGDEFELPSFTSVSRSAKVASDFTGIDDGGVVFQVRLPTGTPAIVTNAFEQEIILPPGRKLRIIKKVPVPAEHVEAWGGTTMVIVAEIV